MPSIFISRDQVVAMLIKERCKQADKRARAGQRKEFIARENLPRSEKPVEKEVHYQLFPPRNRWCGLGNDRGNMDSVKRNELKLKYTYLKAKRSRCTEDWYISLCEYADGIVRSALNPPDTIDPPKVFVIEKKRKKEKKTIIYRPICSFPSGIKIIFSLLNKFLTKVFDDAFYDCSYAFRARRMKYKFQHLNAVSAIQEYRKQHSGSPLYVAECDMQKFYDTIRHEVVKKRFCMLLQWAKREGRISVGDAKLAKRWFFLYVDCFDFRRHVLINNRKAGSDAFWNRRADSSWKCNIEWVPEWEAVRLKGKVRKRNSIGVPQGGPLSGLIANIIMHNVDKAVYRQKEDADILYCRFCDDMLLVGSNRSDVVKVFTVYQEAVKKSKLRIHEPAEMKVSRMRDFWNGKTRGPYEWNEKGTNVYPWITFVGFDINWRGNLRIRKKSLKKEIAKQHKVAYELLLPYRKGKNPRYCSGTILYSLTNRLISMSVGRVKIWNYRNFNNNYCWIDAFSILDYNPWSVAQLQQLDRHRNIVIKRASEELKRIDCPGRKKASSSEEEANNRFIYKGSPYSYYGQCFAYKDKLQSSISND